MLISYFKGPATNKKPFSDISILEALKMIRTGLFKTEIKKIRSTSDKNIRTVLKKQLGWFTFSGTFKYHSDEKLIKHSSLICIDIDHVADYDATFKLICEDQLTYAAFRSPSGDGIKIIIRTSVSPLDTFNHGATFDAIKKYYIEKFNITIDPLCRNVSRACFVSYDENLFTNSDSKYFRSTFDDKEKSVNKNVDPTTFKKESATDNYADIVEAAHAFANKKSKNHPEGLEYTSGFRNQYLIKFANECNRLGLAIEDCLAYSMNEFEDSINDGLAATIRSGYKRIQDHNTKLLKPFRHADKKLEHKSTVASLSTTEKLPEGTKEIGEFWYVVEELDKNGVVKGNKVVLIYNKMILFLEKNGFVQLKIANKNKPDTAQYVHIKDNIAKVVDERAIKSFVLDWVRDVMKKTEVWEMLLRGASRYFNASVLHGIREKELTFKRDTADQAFLFFKNCYIAISKEKITSHDYKELDAHVWHTQVIKKDFKFIDTNLQCDFAQFIIRATVGKEINSSSECTEIESKNILSITSSIGYLMHGFKDPAVAKAITFFDAKISDNNTPEGRTGKSLIFTGISKVIPTAIIDGKTFNFQDKYRYSKVNLDTRLVVYNDITPKFDFEKLFHSITETFSFENKFIDAVELEYDISPKSAVTSNYVLRGSGGSYEARQHQGLLSDYFSPTRTPLIEFKKRFFTDWSIDEWQSFYSFMASCIQQYLNDGLLKFHGNYEFKKLLSDLKPELMDYFAEIIIGKKYNKKELYTIFKDRTGKDFEWLKQNTWTNQLKAFCIFFDLRINKHMPHGRERDHDGNDFITISLPDGIGSFERIEEYITKHFPNTLNASAEAV